MTPAARLLLAAISCASATSGGMLLAAVSGTGRSDDARGLLNARFIETCVLGDKIAFCITEAGQDVLAPVRAGDVA